MTTKKKLKNIVENNKFVNLSTNTVGFIPKAAREVYSSLKK